jgi:hypothetical protein
LTLFTTLQQPLTLACLQTYPTLEAAREACVAQLADLLRQHHQPTPDATAQAIYDHVHQPQLEATPITTRTKSRLLLALASQLAPLLDQISTKSSRTLPRSPAVFATILTAASSRASHEPASASRPGSWQDGATSGSGMERRPVSRR